MIGVISALTSNAASAINAIRPEIMPSSYHVHDQLYVMIVTFTQPLREVEQI